MVLQVSLDIPQALWKEVTMYGVYMGMLLLLQVLVLLLYKGECFTITDLIDLSALIVAIAHLLNLMHLTHLMHTVRHSDSVLS